MQVKANSSGSGYKITQRNRDTRAGIFTMQIGHLPADHHLSDDSHLSDGFHLSNDYRPGCCDRCGHHTAVLPEIGPQAENVCRRCLQRAFEADYGEYRRLLAGEHHRAAG